MISNWFKIFTVATVVLACYAGRSNMTDIVEGCSNFLDGNRRFERSKSEKTTILTFYIEQKAEQEEDYIEMSFTIKEKANSLKKAIENANKKTALAKQQYEEYCKRNKGKNCEKRAEIDNFKAEPSYQILRKEPIFNGFIVTNVAKIQVIETENIGELVDSLLGLGIYQMNELEWKPFVEIDSVEKAIDSGISQATELCRHINKKIGSILSITEIFEEDGDDENKGDQDISDDDDDEDEEEPAILKFEVECIAKTPEEIEAEKSENLKSLKKAKGKK